MQFKSGALALSVSVSLFISTQLVCALTSEEAAKVNNFLNEGRVAITQNRPKDALEKFRAANQIAPNLALVTCNLGFALERCGKYDEALQYLKLSIKQDPTIPIAWVNLAGLYQSTGNIPHAIVTFEEYLKRFPNDSNVSEAKSILAILRDTKNVNAKNNVSGESPDYYSSIVKNGVEKWDTTRFPLKVFVSKGDPAQGYKDSFDSAIRSAFTEWQNKTNNVVSFTFVDAAASADVVVNWTNDEHMVAIRGEAGDCRTRLGTNGIQHATITMLMIAPSDSIPLGDALVHWVGMHEIGHALGLAGHSVNSQDIMYATMTYDYDQKGVSARDIATMSKLYQSNVHR